MKNTKYEKISRTNKIATTKEGIHKNDVVVLLTVAHKEKGFLPYGRYRCVELKHDKDNEVFFSKLTLMDEFSGNTIDVASKFTILASNQKEKTESGIEIGQNVVLLKNRSSTSDLEKNGEYMVVDLDRFSQSKEAELIGIYNPDISKVLWVQVRDCKPLISIRPDNGGIYEYREVMNFLNKNTLPLDTKVINQTTLETYRVKTGPQKMEFVSEEDEDMLIGQVLQNILSSWKVVIPVTNANYLRHPLLNERQSYLNFNRQSGGFGFGSKDETPQFHTRFSDSEIAEFKTIYGTEKFIGLLKEGAND